MEHCLCAGKRERERLPVPRVCPSCPLPSLMPFNAATLRLCSSRMFSWDTVRLGCLRMHCMIQCGARGEAPAVGRAGGPCHPCRDPCSSRSSGGRGVTRGSKEREQAAGQREQSKAGEGRVQLGVGLGEVSPPASPTGCEIQPRSLPAAAQVEGTSFPPVIRQWDFTHHFHRLEKSHILFVAPNHCLALVSLSCPRTPGSERAWLHPFSSGQSCSVLFPLTGTEDGA